MSSSPASTSCDIERQHARRLEIERRSVLHQGVPHLDAPIRPASRSRNPDRLCTRCARCPRERRPMRPRRHAEVFQRLDVGLRRRPQHARRRGTLKRQRRNTFRDILDLDVQPDGVLPKPSQAGIGGGPSIRLLVQPRDRPVIDDLALLVAPGRVPDLPDAHASGVTRDDAVDEPRRVSAGDAVLEQRRDVDERRRVANGVVFVLVVLSYALTA